MASGSRSLDAKSIVILIILIIFSIITAFVITKVPSSLALVVAIGIATLIVCFVWPPISLYILIFSMLLSPEFGQRDTQGEGFTIRLDDLILVLVSFSWLAKSSLYKELGLFPKTPLNRGIAAYVIICLFSTVLGGLFGKINLTGFMFVLKYFEYFMVFFMAVNFIDTRKQAKTFLILLLITCMIVSFYALSQLPLGGRVSTPFEGKEGEPGTLGGYLILLMSVCIGLVLTSESKRVKISLTGLTIISFVALMATQSRATWMGLPVMYLCFVVMSKKRLMLLALLAVIIAVGPFIMPETYKERYGGTFKREEGYKASVGGKDLALDSSATQRVQSWQGCLKDFKNHPIFGYGINGYWFIDGQYFRTLVELGLLGMSIFIFMLYQIGKFLLAAYRISSDNLSKGLAMGLFAGFLALLVHCFGSNTFIVVRIMEPFWFLMGIAVVLYHIDKKKFEALHNESEAHTASVH
ncbi:MAG: O-antigen ligase family protein [Candidatus Brocadiales bacterium]|nr:O-antigen ligase family protein [Candidatus Brocadiales bacterium]